ETARRPQEASSAPPDPKLLEFVKALARAAAREDHRRAAEAALPRPEPDEQRCEPPFTHASRPSSSKNAPSKTSLHCAAPTRQKTASTWPAPTMTGRAPAHRFLAATA